MFKLRGDGGGGHKTIIRWMTSSDSFDVGWTHIQWMIDVRADGAAQSVFFREQASLQGCPGGPTGWAACVSRLLGIQSTLRVGMASSFTLGKLDPKHPSSACFLKLSAACIELGFA